MTQVQPRLFAETWAKVLQRSEEPAIYGDDRTLLRTFADIEVWTGLLWREKLSGLAKGSIFLIQSVNDAEWPGIFLAALDLSLVMVPLETEVTGPQFDNVVKVTRPQAVIRSTDVSRLDSDPPNWAGPRPDLLKRSRLEPLDFRVPSVSENPSFLPIAETFARR